MPVITPEGLTQARAFVVNFRHTGNIHTEGQGALAPIRTRDEFAAAWIPLKAQFPNEDESTHVHSREGYITGSGGALLALLEHVESSLQQSLAVEIDNAGNSWSKLITTESGGQLKILKSGCSTSDAHDFAARRGLFAGQPFESVVG